MSTTLLPVIAGGATRRGEMKKIRFTRINDNMELGEKVNEIVDWINTWERLQEEEIKGQIPLIPRSSTIKLKGI